MRMSSYCREVPCVRRLIQVNSPRYKRELLIRSNTAGLQYTAFAARYNSLVEEIFFRAAVRLRF